MEGASTYLGRTLAHLQDSVGGLLPELLLIGGFLAVIVLELVGGRRYRLLVPMAAIGTVILHALAIALLWPPVDAGATFLGMVRVDAFSAYMRLLVDAACIVSIAAAADSTKLRVHSKGMGEYFIVTLGMAVGMAFMTMAQNLVMMYLALEMVSLPAYVLTAYARMKHKGAEAGLKYVLYGCFASGLMLYGISWLYGFTGGFLPNAAGFGQGLLAAGLWPTTIMLALVLGGFAFKVGALPFHFWMPDALEGAPHPVATLLSVAPKVAGFAMLIRFLALLRMGLPEDVGAELWRNIAWLLGAMAIGSMVLGNLVALRQGHLRRMLAYSSIAHAGYVLAGLLMIDAQGYAVAMFYLGIYLCMNMAAFLLAGWLEEEAGVQHIKELKGMAGSLPVVAVLTTLCMVSLTGLPPTAGFIAKLRLFLAGLAAYKQAADPLLIILLVMVLLNTVVSLFYYLRVASSMVFGNPTIKSWPAFRGWVPAMIVIISLPLLWLGIFSFDAFINFLQGLAPSVLP